MSYVGDPFLHDLFISYSHGDVDGSGRSKLKQWSQGFAQELESELRALPRLGKTLKIFLDQHAQPDQGLDPMAPLSQQLNQDIGGSALLTVLMSPQYLASKWCADERSWWLAQQPGHGIPSEGRLAVARIWPTEHEQWPTELKDERGHALIGFSFHDPARGQTHPQPYDWPQPDPAGNGEFRKALLDMVARIAPRLDEIRQLLEARRRNQEEARKLSAQNGQLIYLYGRQDHAGEWEAAFDSLQRGGYGVFPSEPDPVAQDPEKAQDLRRARVEVLSGCDALLLLGVGEGLEIDADLVTVGMRDRQSARAIANRLLPCGLLNRAGAGIATPRRKTVARALQVDWIDPQNDPWTLDVQHWLSRRGSAAETRP